VNLIINGELEAKLSNDYSYTKLVNSAPISAGVAVFLFERSSAIFTQKHAGAGPFAHIKQNLGQIVAQSIRWYQTRSDHS
jgi:hypothetical protein